jgi:hypothetical protein
VPAIFDHGNTLYDITIVVEWLTLLLHIRKFLDSNLSLETGYPD